MGARCQRDPISPYNILIFPFEVTERCKVDLRVDSPRVLFPGSPGAQIFRLFRKPMRNF